jgi:predicted nucleotidyltransferase
MRSAGPYARVVPSSFSPGGAVSPERAAEAERIIERVTRWAARRPEVVGLLLAGSYARGAARPDSDLDFVLLTSDETGYADDAWAHELAHELTLGALTRVQSWGAVTERRFTTGSGLDVEINVGSPGWASTDPVDPGTRRVVSDGARLLHDPAGVLAALRDTVCR